MKTETLETLRVRAKKLGLAGYSKMRKAELLKLIASHKPAVRNKTAARSKITATRKPKTPTKPHRAVRQPVRATLVSPSPAPSRDIVAPTASDTEQRVESAKYAYSPPGTPAPLYAADLGEDIDRLPALREPLLCLLPQKPGILHGYWVLPADLQDAGRDTRLRLAAYTGDRLTVLGEHPAPSARGRWYFQIEEGIELGTVYLQLGRYRPDGEFVSIVERGIARIPSLYASAPTDRRWWVSDAQFREMARRAGDPEHGRQHRRTGSASSPEGPLAWLGNRSGQH